MANVLQTILERLVLYRILLSEAPGVRSTSEDPLLSRFDVVTLPTHTDYNAKSQPILDRKDMNVPFWVLHADTPSTADSRRGGYKFAEYY